MNATSMTTPLRVLIIEDDDHAREIAAAVADWFVRRHGEEMEVEIRPSRMRKSRAYSDYSLVVSNAVIEMGSACFRPDRYSEESPRSAVVGMTLAMDVMGHGTRCMLYVADHEVAGRESELVCIREYHHSSSHLPHFVQSADTQSAMGWVCLFGWMMRCIDAKTWPVVSDENSMARLHRQEKPPMSLDVVGVLRKEWDEIQEKYPEKED